MIIRYYDDRPSRESIRYYYNVWYNDVSLVCYDICTSIIQENTSNMLILSTTRPKKSHVVSRDGVSMVVYTTIWIPSFYNNIMIITT